jgi:hypothetical protein
MRQTTARPGADQGPIADLGLLERWQWRRVQRRVVAEHERWVLSTLRRLAAEQVAALPTCDQPSSPGAVGAAGIVRLDLPGWWLLLAGVAPEARAALAAAARQGPLRLAGAGRYGPFWWVEVAREDGGHKIVTLSARLRMTPSQGGRGRPRDPAWAGGHRREQEG